MNELINITLNKNHEPVVSGRQLHEKLGLKTEYKKMVQTDDRVWIR